MTTVNALRDPCKGLILHYSPLRGGIAPAFWADAVTVRVATIGRGV